MSDDVHTPTNAGPDPVDFAAAYDSAGVAAESDDNPEVLVGAAFAGGVVAAMILKRMFGS